MAETLRHFIDGNKVDGRSGRAGDVFNPATGEVIAKVPLADAAQVADAVSAAVSTPSETVNVAVNKPSAL